ncbi:NtaA/DmoA family FMN-dependent monooxygenase [Streptomyces spiralis]|uniref:NtaA/DmoA family FMN-dependent monooxygenase n=1 Tax=Streptomyces spiralis TaxID=66376 RepID=UPI00340D0176
MSQPRQLHLFASGSARAARLWRHPGIHNDTPSLRRELIEKAHIAEKAKFDGMFFADVHNYGPRDTWGYKLPEDFEPFTTAAALSFVTERLGLAITGSTTLQAPYHVARQLLSLDHLNGGRTGWNVVTSFSQAAADNIGAQPLASHDERYAMADEALDVVKKLWDSWDDDTIIEDRKSGVFQDVDKIYVPDHHGAYYDAKGPIGARRSPQGQPVIFQAGSSPTGSAFAARHAEVIFTAHGAVDQAVAFADQVQKTALAAGRPRRPLITPALQVTVGSTDAEAKAAEREVYEYFSPEFQARWLLEFEIDVTHAPLDGPVPESAFPDATSGHQTALAGYRKLAAESSTVREFLFRTGSHWGARSTGSAEQIADTIQDWFESGAIDGFVVGTSGLPGQLRAFAEQVVPLLQERGLFRREYTGHTLRDHLGLEAPINRNRVS